MSHFEIKRNFSQPTSLTFTRFIIVIFTLMLYCHIYTEYLLFNFVLRATFAQEERGCVIFKTVI